MTHFSNPTLGYKFDLAYDYDHQVFNRELVDQGFKYRREGEWATDAEDLAYLDTLLLRDQGDHHLVLIGYAKDALLWVRIRGGNATVTVGAFTFEELDECWASIQEQLPSPTVGENQLAPITFWYHTDHGPVSVRRQLEVPTWSDIQHNYAAAVAAQLEQLVAAREPAGGKLLLWSGPPGTGKTFGIRALAWEWREWVDFHYLIDPERFFGDAAADLVHVALENGSNGPIPDDIGQRNAKRRWKLLVLEDTGEMLTSDAKARVGQALSRLLNLVDGLLGQGLNVLALITTNEEVGELHPAILRPGRCWEHVKFGLLSREEARRWMSARSEGGSVVAAPALLADLFAELNSWSQRQSPKRMGFFPADRDAMSTLVGRPGGEA